MALYQGTSPVQGLYLGTTPIQVLYLGTVIVWQNEVQVVISANQTGVIMASLPWPTGVWESSVNKRVIVQAGVTLTGAAWGAIAPQGGSQPTATWGGRLILENRGDIFGLGGAPNGGLGGAALYDELGNTPAWGKTVGLINTGRIFAGGGGGGSGQTTGTSTEGPTFVAGYRYVDIYTNMDIRQWSARWYWNGVQVWANGGPYPQTQPPSQVVGSDGATYTLGTNVGAPTYYNQITRIGSSTVATNGGRGQGHDGVNTAGGTNAGTGGTWGQPGGAGNVGGGGAAGVAYRTLVFDLISNTGQILGRVT